MIALEAGAEDVKVEDEVYEILTAPNDFSAVRDDEDELRLAVDTAVSSLAPRVRLTAATHAVDGRRAVLRETLLEFARHGGGDLDALIGLLNNLPQ